MGGEAVNAEFRVVLVQAENRDFKLPVPSFFKVESNLHVAEVGNFGPINCQSGCFWVNATMACFAGPVGLVAAASLAMAEFWSDLADVVSLLLIVI